MKTQHPNIVSIKEIFTGEKFDELKNESKYILAFVMELANRSLLEDIVLRIKCHNPYTEKEFKNIALQVIEALYFMYYVYKIQHRDIKPGFT